MTIIATYSTLDEAYLARMKLEGSGVEAFLSDEAVVTMYWLYSHAVGGVKLKVRDEDIERAKEILEIEPMEEGIVKCPHCGSERVAYRKMSWMSFLSWFAGLLLPIPSSKIDCLNCKRSFDQKEFYD